MVGNYSHLESVKNVENMLFYNGRKIFIIDSAGIFRNNIKPDILILTQSPKLNMDRVLETLHPSIVIADASNSISIQKRWKTTCNKKKIPFHAIAEKGFYKIN